MRVLMCGYKKKRSWEGGEYMTESGIISELQGANNIQLLSLVTGMDTMTRRLERIYLAAKNEIDRRLPQIEIMEANRIPEKEILIYKRDCFIDYCADSHNDTMDGETVINDIVSMEIKNKRKKKSQTNPGSAQKVMTYLEDNQTFLSWKDCRVVAMDDMSSEMLDMCTEIKITKRNRTEQQLHALITADLGFNCFAYGLDNPVSNGAYHVDYSDNRVFCIANAKEVIGWNGNPAIGGEHGFVGTAKGTDRGSINRMHRLTYQDGGVRIVQPTLAPNINVEFSGPVTKEADVDEVILHLGALLWEQIASAPEGVYE